MYNVRPARTANDRFPSHEYLEELKGGDPGSHSKMIRLLERFRDEGPDKLGERYKPLKGPGSGLVQFEIWKHRLLGWRDENTVFLTHGFKKDQDETPPEQIERAFRIKEEHLSRMGEGRKRHG